MLMNVVVFVIDRYLWAIRPFAYLFNKYWGESQPVTVVGFAHPPFDLPSNFDFYSLGDFVDYPKEKWSDAIIKFLDWYQNGHEQFILMLEDYWLKSPVDTQALENVYGYTLTHYQRENILRTDLINDGGVWRNHYNHPRVFNGVPGYQKSVQDDYDASLQASIWPISKMRSILKPNENPWVFEQTAQRRAGGDEIIITTQKRLLDYYIVISSQHGGYYHLGLLNQEDAQYIRNQGWLEGVSLRESFDGS